MTCSKCNAPIDAQTKDAVGKRIAKVLFWISLFLLVLGFLFEYAMIKTNLNSIGSRSKDVFVAIEAASLERISLGLPSLWPNTYLMHTNHPGDISSTLFTNSSDYFYELYDGSNVGTAQHHPYAKFFDYSKLIGEGIRAKEGKGKLLAENNIWIIAANLSVQDNERIPVLLTRNVDVKEIERVVNQGLKQSDFETKIAVGKGRYKTPFGSKAFVCVRKGGGIFCDQSGKKTLGELFGNKELPPRDPSKPPIVYLMP